MRKIASIMVAIAVPYCAHSATLTTGEGDGSLTVQVNDFGYSNYALFNPVSAEINASDVFYSSGMFISYDGSTLSSFSGNDAYVLTDVSNQYVTSYSYDDLLVTLSQIVAPTINLGEVVGATLVQSYEITNNSDQNIDFTLVRYLDGDLYLTDSTLADGGGVIQNAGQTILFETDASGEGTAEDTFVGIMVSGGSDADPLYSVLECCGTQLPMTGSVANDVDGDGFTDTAYDVTLSMAQEFSISPLQSATFTTTTLFGNYSGEASLPEPGASEAFPILPDEISVSESGLPVYTFNVPVLEPEDIVWIDPDIAVGYVYQVTGADFASITAPSYLSIADADGYTVIVNGEGYALSSGETLVFDDPISSFILAGIDAALMLDPTDATAFMLGVSLVNFSADGASITQSPLIADAQSNISPVPLPLTGMLLLSSLGMFGVQRLRRLSSQNRQV